MTTSCSFNLLSMFVCASFPFAFECGMCDLIVLVPDCCLSFYFKLPLQIPYLFGYKTGVSFSRMTINNKISQKKFCYKTSFTLPKKNPKDLDPSYKTDSDFWD